MQAQVTAPDTTVTRTATSATPAASSLTFYRFVDGYFGYDFHDLASHVRPSFPYSHNHTNEFASSGYSHLGGKYNPACVL